MNKLVTLAALAASVLAISACTQEQKVAAPAAPGTYETESKTTDANGTSTAKKTTKKVSVDANGKKKVVTNTKTSTDPKGLMNKQTTETTDTSVQK